MTKVPDEWSITTLGTVAKTKSVRRNPAEIPSSVFLGMNSVESNSSNLLITQSTDDVKSSVLEFKKNDLLYGRLRPYLRKVVVVDFDGYASAEFIIFKPSKYIDQGYLKLVLKSPEFTSFANSRSKGDRPRVVFSSLKDFKFLLPPLDEQKRIVAQSDIINSKINLVENELSDINKSIENLWVKTLKEGCEGKLPAAQFDVNGLTTTLKEVTVDIRYGTSKKCLYNPSETAVLRIPNIQNGKIDVHDLKHAKFSIGELEKLALKRGDILLIRSNGSIDLVGRSALVLPEHENYLFAGYLIRMRFDLTRILPEFIYFALCSPQLRKQIESYSKSTSGVNNINSQQLQRLKVPIPKLNKQKELVDYLTKFHNALQKLLGELENANSDIQALKDSLLQRVMSGELDTSNVDEDYIKQLYDHHIIEEKKKSDNKNTVAVIVKNNGAETVKKSVGTFRSILEGLDDWHPASDLASRYGIKNGTSSDDIEAFYTLLRKYVLSGEVVIERRGQEDWLKFSGVESKSNEN